jgi:hypothetical protein
MVTVEAVALVVPRTPHVGDGAATAELVGVGVLLELGSGVGVDSGAVDDSEALV